jgi:general secretion pathway protein H
MPKRLETGNARWPRACPTRQLACWVTHEAGFTLLELLVVLAIMVIAVTAFPLALDRALPGRRVRTATEHLEAVIRHAEVQSIALDQPQRLSVAELTSQFARTTHLQTTGPGGVPLRALVAYPDGSTNGARFVVSDGSDRRTVVVSEITGRINVDAR